MSFRVCISSGDSSIRPDWFGERAPGRLNPPDAWSRSAGMRFNRFVPLLLVLLFVVLFLTACGKGGGGY